MIQANNEATILECVKMFGPAPGAKKMLTWEFIHARQAAESGVYLTWRSTLNGQDCFRIGSFSKCFCGDLFKNHEKKVSGKKQITKCKDCKCKEFKFIPRRPEELGQWWMPRRKGFDINKFRAKC